MKTTCWVSLLVFSTALQAAPPAPQVTVGADIKQLRFDWLPVAGAARYELWQRSTSNGAWFKIHDRPAAATYTIIAVSAHLLDWAGARWRVDACDSSGCTPSADISATSLMHDSLGYIKPVPVQPPRYFGLSTALSADGRTLAVLGSEWEINFRRLPYIYIYRRVGSTWSFDARLAVENTVENGTFGNPIALNFDGDVLVWGTEFAEYPNDTGGTVYRGAVYVFRRVAGAWQQEFKVTPPPDQTMYLGHDVDVSDDGERFVVSYQSLPYRMGHTRIYQRIAGAWQLEKTLTMRTSGSHWAECLALALSGDGQRVVRYCTRSPHSPELAGKYVETYSAPRWTIENEIQLGSHIHDPDLLRAIGTIDINGDGTRLVSWHAHEGTLSVWRWNGSGWKPDSLTGALAILPTRGVRVAMSRNGNLIVQSDQSGIVYIYERRGGRWTLRQSLRAGSSLALGDNGSVLAVGTVYDNSGATGVGGDQNDTSAPFSGAVWLY